jgi:hydrogenase nickel incorporation protein HypB
MSEVRVIQINESVFAENGREAELIRSRLTAQGTLFLNFMSSPGSGKTTTLVALINRLKGSLNIGEMDVDIESSLDAQRVADRTGIRSLQIHNGGLCHFRPKGSYFGSFRICRFRIHDRSFRHGQHCQHPADRR